MYALIACALVVLAGCSSGTDSSRAAALVTSWTSTARSTAKAWLADAVPDQYARRTLELAAERLAELRPDAHATHAAQETVGQLRDAVATRDRATVREKVAALEAEQPR